MTDTPDLAALRRAYVEAIGTPREMAACAELMRAVDASRRKGKR